MKAKFNGKDYSISIRLNENGEDWIEIKEIESKNRLSIIDEYGIDCYKADKPKQGYKNGDMLRTDNDNLFIFKDTITHEGIKCATGHVFVGCDNSSDYREPLIACFMDDIDRYCTPAEEKLIHDRLKLDGKRWNADKKCVEDIQKEPQRKFKVGDKVRIKDGISSETDRDIKPCFVYNMDQFLGMIMTVRGYSQTEGYVECDGNCYYFKEDWLEPWIDEIKVGDTVIAWGAYDLDHKMAIIGVVNKIGGGGSSKYYVSNLWYRDAIKWDGTPEQFEKVRSGLI